MAQNCSESWLYIEEDGASLRTLGYKVEIDEKHRIKGYHCLIRKIREPQETTSGDANEYDKTESAESNIGEYSTLEIDYEEF